MSLRKGRAISCLIILLLSALANTSFGQSSKALYKKDHYFLKTENTDENYFVNYIKGIFQEVISVEKAFKIDDPTLSGYYLLFTRDKMKIGDITNNPDKYPLITWIEKVPQYQFFRNPNDPSFSNQYALKKIKAEKAWDLITGTASILVGIVDDAVLSSHEDLKNLIWQNPGEVASNGIDDDKNGYIDDVNGWDVADNDNDPNPPSSKASKGTFTHGTHCAGIAAAETDNSQGIASVSFNVTIMPVKIAEDKTEKLTAAYSGVEYAIKNSANVISMSWGGGAYSKTYQAIFDYGHKNNIIFVAAAGNSNTDVPMYPASYNYVISVAASDSGDKRASFSNYGSTIDVTAPGVGIYSTKAANSSSYGNLSGTSMACPLVSGLCALMLSKNSSLSPDDLEKCLKSSSDDIDKINSSYAGKLGAGRINAYTAIQCLKPVTANYDATPVSTCLNDTITFKNMSSANASSYKWLFNGGTPSQSTLKNPKIVYSSFGSYDVTLIAYSSKGNDTITKTGFIQIADPGFIVYTKSIIGAINRTAIGDVAYSGGLPYNLIYKDPNGKYDTIKNIVSNYSSIEFPAVVSGKIQFVKAYDKHCNINLKDTMRINRIDFFDSCDRRILTRRLSPGSISNAAICRGSDKNLWVLSFASGSVGKEDFQLYKLNDTGMVLFRKNIGTSNSDLGYMPELTPSFDGGVYITGTTVISSLFYGVIIKIDKNGNIKWSKRLSGKSHVRELVEYTKDTIIFSGSYLSSNPETPFLGMMDSAGNLKWLKYYQVSTSDHNHTTTLAAFNSKIFIHCHSGGSSSGYAVTLCTDLGGNIVWKHNFDSTGKELGIALTTGNDGNSIVTLTWINSVGKGSYDALLTKLSSSGNVIWQRVYGNSADNQGRSIVSLGQGLGYVVGMNNYSGSKKEASLLWVDDNGKYISNYQLDNSSKIDFASNNSLLAILAKGSVMLASIEDVSGSNKIRLDRVSLCPGNFSCKTVRDSFALTTASFRARNITFSPSNGLGLTNITYSISNIKDSSSLVCRLPVSKTKFDTICHSIGLKIQIKTKFCGDTVLLKALSDSLDLNLTKHGVKWKINNLSLNGNDSIIYLLGKKNIINVGLYIVDSYGCRDSAFLSANPVKTKSVSLRSPTKICFNDSAKISLDNYFCDFTGYKIRWSPSGSLDNDTISNPIATPLLSTTYTVTLTGIDTIRKSIVIIVDSSCCKPIASYSINEPSCLSDSIQFLNLSYLENSTTEYYWNFGTKASIQTYKGRIPPRIKFNSPGLHGVKLIMKNSCGSDSLYSEIMINPLPFIDLQDSIILCKPDTVNVLKDRLSSLIYQTSDMPNTYFVNDRIEYYVNKTTSLEIFIRDFFTGCENNDSILLIMDDPITSDILRDSIICGSQDIVLIKQVDNLKQYWLEAPAQYYTKLNSFYYTSKNSATIILHVKSIKTNCEDTDTANIRVDNQININFQRNFILCQNDSLILNADTVKAKKIIWEHTNTSSTKINKTGVYKLIALNDVCTDTALITVKMYAGAKLDIISDTTICGLKDIAVVKPIDPSKQYRLLNPAQYYILSNSLFYRPTKTSSIIIGVKSATSICEDFDTAFIKIDSPINIGFPTKLLVCDKDSIVLNADTLNAKTIFWEISKSSKLTVYNNGSYKLFAKNDVCKDSVIVTVTFDTTLSIRLPDDIIICEEHLSDGILIDVQEIPYNVRWHDGSVSKLRRVRDTLDHIITVSNNCSQVRDTFRIRTKECFCKIFVPTSFTPNSDGINDKYNFSLNCRPESFEVNIFNRWGEIVYRSEDPDFSWDGNYMGKRLIAGIYIIHYKYKFINTVMITETEELYIFPAKY